MGLNLFPECIVFSNHNKKTTLIDPKGGRSRYIIINNESKEIDCYKIDGCIKYDGNKCDYLFLNITDTSAYLIELKGSDLLKAIMQIDTTLTIVYKKLDNFKINARIILSKVYAPNINSTHYIKLRKRISSLNGTIRQGSNNYLEEIL